MSTILKTEPREALGTRASRKLRDSGRIPASVQAVDDKAHVNLSIDEAEFLTTRRHHEHLYDLEVGGKTESVLVRELQWDVFGERITHVEFRRVDVHKVTEVDVPLEFVGRPKGGVLNQMVTELTVKAKPGDIPDSIEVAVGDLEAGHALHASDLKLPAGVELGIDPETPIASVVAAASEDDIAPAEGEGEETVEGDEAAAEGGDAPSDTPSEG